MIFLDSDTLYCVHGLQDQTTGEYVNDASIAGTISNQAGDVLATFGFNFVPESNGNYQGVIPQAVASTYCVDGGQYLVSVEATIGAGITTWGQIEFAGFNAFNQ